MTSRTTLSRPRRIAAAELHDILAREFEKSAAGLCSACRVPKPVFHASVDGGPNWRVPPLEECSALCHTILQDIAENLGKSYELAK